MKIQCLSSLLCLACLSLSTSSSVRVRAFRSQKSLTNTAVVERSDHAPSLGLVAQPGGPVEPESKPYDPVQHVERIVIWNGTSSVNFEFTLFVAAVWVLMLGSTPVLIYKLGDKKVTKSAMVLAVLMWIALFGGLYLFTNIILFNSPHFEHVRSLTIIECTYFMTQVITTVGYGDITPAYPRGQVFVGAYVTLAFFVIALLMSEMQIVVMAKVFKYEASLKKQFAKSLETQDSTNALNSSRPLGFKPEHPSYDGVCWAVGIFAGVATVWIFFFHFYPGEDKTWLEATYMSLITLTTVGFGAVTPVTEGGMLFGAFFMFLGSSALVNVLGQFSAFILELDRYESWCPDDFKSDLKNFRKKYSTGKGQSLSQEAFLILNLLQTKKVTEQEIDAIQASYVAMAGSRGDVNLKGIVSNVSSEINPDDLDDSDAEAAHDTAGR